MDLLKLFFGAKAQIAVGLVFVALTSVELAVWWKPTLQQVFLVSMEALYFAAYGVIATGIALLGVERVERHVDPSQEA